MSGVGCDFWKKNGVECQVFISLGLSVILINLEGSLCYLSLNKYNYKNNLYNDKFLNNMSV